MPNVNNIIEWNARRGRFPTTANPIYKLQNLRRAWDASLKTSEATQDYLPMRLVTLIEVFVRSLLKEVVDAGPPYLERAETLLRGTKLDFVFALNLHGKKITIGDLVAHSVSANNITSIVSNINTLLPGYTELLKTTYDRWDAEVIGRPKTPLISDLDKTLSILARLFEVRHIITHELPEEPPYALQEIDGFFVASEEFMSATDWLVSETLNGKAPLTQAEMNFTAGAKLNAELEKLSDVVRAIREKDDVNDELLVACQESWEVFVESEAALHASLVEGGSMYPMIYAHWKMITVQERIKALQWWIDRREGEV